mgnify:CR=1 FL=1
MIKVKTSVNNNKVALNDKLIRLRDDVIVPFSRIDIIIKSDKNPSTGEKYSSPRWIVYLCNVCKYQYITITEEDFLNIKNLL